MVLFIWKKKNGGRIYMEINAIFAPGRPSSLYRQKFLFGPRWEVRPDFFYYLCHWFCNAHI